MMKQQYLATSPAGVGVYLAQELLSFGAEDVVERPVGFLLLDRWHWPIECACGVDWRTGSFSSWVLLPCTPPTIFMRLSTGLIGALTSGRVAR